MRPGANKGCVRWLSWRQCSRQCPLERHRPHARPSSRPATYALASKPPVHPASPSRSPEFRELAGPGPVRRLRNGFRAAWRAPLLAAREGEGRRGWRRAGHWNRCRTHGQGPEGRPLSVQAKPLPPWARGTEAAGAGADSPLSGECSSCLGRTS